ncbi:MAG: DUF4351 domain-containing protein [Gammaproteobacteria bacterium]|nr:DUF4351 domain-containing protein [Gammaproteobacteria bacterium]MBU1654196.1 DUF4351 domain-containing protein [Gammaproteobacteria bacterium]MBU1960856.1 DUF4351 domain-containing protein [Gammaproteobacteria bacterium]
MILNAISCVCPEGRAEGRAEGRGEGRLEGGVRLLTRQLEHRFGPLPQAVHDRLAAASEGQLEAWGEAVLTAPSLDALFSGEYH